MAEGAVPLNEVIWRVWAKCKFGHFTKWRGSALGLKPPDRLVMFKIWPVRWRGVGGAPEGLMWLAGWR